MIPVIVAGAGLIGSRHIAHVITHPWTELVGIVEPSSEIDLPAGVPRFGRVKDINIDAAVMIVATPTSTHLEVGRAAAAKGMALLVEKPMTASLAEAEQLIKAAREANVPLIAGYHRRHHAKVKVLKSVIESGRIGVPVGASLIWSARKPPEYFDVSWRNGIGGSPVLINLVHDIDLLRGLFGDVVDLTGIVSARRNAGAADTGAVAMAFSNGAVATMLYSDNAPSPWGFEAGTAENPNITSIGEDCLYITGTKGSVAFPSLKVFSGSNEWSQPQSCTVAEVENTALPLDAQLDHMCDVVEGKAQPMVTGEDALETLRLALRVEALLNA